MSKKQIICFALPFMLPGVAISIAHAQNAPENDPKAVQNDNLPENDTAQKDSQALKQEKALGEDVAQTPDTTKENSKKTKKQGAAAPETINTDAVDPNNADPNKGDPTNSKQRNDGLIFENGIFSENGIFAPKKFDFSAHARIRFESLSNPFKPFLKKHDNVFLFRTNLAMDYHMFDHLMIGAEIIDLRAYNDDIFSNITTSTVNVLEVVQLYAAYQFEGRFKTNIRAGRFTMALGSKRLITRGSFSNVSKGFAGVRADSVIDDNNDVTLFYVMPQRIEPDNKIDLVNNKFQMDKATLSQRFWGGYYRNRDWLPLDIFTDAYFYSLQEHDNPELQLRNRHLFTLGGRLYRPETLGKIDFDVEAAMQFGRVRTTFQVDPDNPDAILPDPIRTGAFAGFVHADIGYTFDHPLSPRLSLVFDWASGNNSNSKTNNRFDGLFGSRNGDFGPTSIFGPLGRENIISPAIKFRMIVLDDITVHAGWRFAWLDQADDAFAKTNIIDTTGKSGKFGGQQINFQVTKNLKKDFIDIDIGAAMFIKSDYFDKAQLINRFGNTRYFYTAFIFHF